MLVCKNETEYCWRPLAQYNIYDWDKRDKEIIIEGTEKYECKNGVLNKTIYLPCYRYKNTIGCILKTLE